MQCPSCKALVSDSARFCPKCGASLAPAPQAPPQPASPDQGAPQGQAYVPPASQMPPAGQVPPSSQMPPAGQVPPSSQMPPAAGWRPQTQQAQPSRQASPAGIASGIDTMGWVFIGIDVVLILLGTLAPWFGVDFGFGIGGALTLPSFGWDILQGGLSLFSNFGPRVGVGPLLLMVFGVICLLCWGSMLAFSVLDIRDRATGRHATGIAHLIALVVAVGLAFFVVVLLPLLLGSRGLDFSLLGTIRWGLWLTLVAGAAGLVLKQQAR